MGYIYLSLAMLAGTFKMIATKKCGSIACGTKNKLIINLIRAIGCIAVSAAVCLIGGFRGTDGAGILLAAICGVSSGIQMCTWMIGAATAPLVTVEVFSMIGGIVIPFIVTPFFIPSDTVSVWKWIGAFLLVLAALCFSKRSGGSITPKSLVIICVSALGNAGRIISQKLLTVYSETAVSDFTLASYIFAAITILTLLLLIRVLFKTKEDAAPAKFTKATVMYICIVIVMMYTAEFLSTHAAARLDSVYYPLAYVISMPLTFLTDTLVFKEKVTRTKVFGIVLVVLAGILTNI